MRILLRGIALRLVPARVSRMPVNSPCAPAAGCKRDCVHAGDLEQAALQQIEDFENALRQRVRPVGMRLGQTLDARHKLVHARVVLHRARAERIHAEIDRVVPSGEAREVANDLDLAQLRQQAGRVAMRSAKQRLSDRQQARRAAAACRRACPARTSRRAALRSASGACEPCRSVRGPGIWGLSAMFNASSSITLSTSHLKFVYAHVMSRY